MFQIEVTYRALLAGFRVVEVPIVFRDRTAGSSKMSAGSRPRRCGRVPACAARRGREVRTSIRGAIGASRPGSATLDT